MVLNALTAFVGEDMQPKVLDLARRLVHFDFKKAGIVLAAPEIEDMAAELIAKLIEQEVARQGDRTTQAAPDEVA